ncbi:MAG: nitrile hydratase subunit alpha [Pseudomonadota bacterium]
MTESHDHNEHEMAISLRTRALESLLIEKGLISADVIDGLIDRYENDIGPMNGAKVVAKAWLDAGYKSRLLNDGTAAIAELGFGGRQGAQMVVLENTDDIHNVVVCTLCSCYPWPVLGLPPSWYKSYAYRSRVVKEPRAVLREFGLELPASIQVKVWDSNSDVRYMVLPKPPHGVDTLSENEAARLVTRDAMIGVETLDALDARTGHR